MKRLKTVLIVLLAISVSIIFVSCSFNKDKTASVKEMDLESYPLKGDLTFTCWRQLDANLSATVSNMAESEFSKELAKRTGVTVNYYHPASGNLQEGFNILISSGDLPDLIYYPWEWYPGGAVKAIADNHIIPINDYLDKYAPDYKAYIEANPEVDRALRTENGDYYGFNNIKNDRLLCTSAGLMMRKDWLEESGLEEPETMDEIYAVLTAMKNKGVELPYSGNLYQAGQWGIFTGAYGVLPELYVEDNKVVYGSIRPGYKEYLATMNKWFKEGLIDNSFPTLDAKTINSNIMNGYSAMTNGSGGAGMGVYLQTMRNKNPKFDLVGLKVPVLNKGDKPMSGHISPRVSGHCVAITTACKNPAAAARYLNYLYTDEGHIFANFGIEGLTYEMVNGEPKYTEFITKNPDGLSMSAVMAQYMISSSVGGAFIQDERYIMQYYQYEQQVDALKKWSDTDAEKHLLPNLNIAPDKISEISRILTDINTYSNSMTLKFIMGTESLDKYDEFVANMKAMGVEKVEQAYTEALVRYYNK